MKILTAESGGYASAMGHLLVLYTQVDQFIMEVCAERVASAPDATARAGLVKQVGDEQRHVNIQRQWMYQFGVDPSPLINAQSLDQLHAHFRQLDWTDFLIDLYLVIEALGSQAVEQVVPLADPGTRESLRVPLQDELDHIAFGLAELRKVLEVMDAQSRQACIDAIPARIDAVLEMLEGLDLPVLDWFEQVGSDPRQLQAVLDRRRGELVTSLAA